MLICYLDESGNTGLRLDDPHQPVHWISSVIVQEDRIGDMVAQLNRLADEAPTTGPLIEYHGDELFHGSGAWEGVPPRLRIREYAKALAVLQDVDAGVAYAAINKRRLAAGQNPHLLALQFLAEKIERWLRGQADDLNKRALLVADHSHEHDQYAFELIRGMQLDGGPVGSSRSLNIRLERIVDGVYFAHSERNRGIQLADLVAFVLNRSDRSKRRPGDPRSDAAVTKLISEYIAPQLRTWRQLWPR